MTLGNGALSNAAARAVDINGGNASIGFAGNIANNGTGIAIANKNGGTVTLSGAAKTLTTGANAAVTLASNTGAAIDFSGGGLSITTTSGSGFSASGGGTVTVTNGASPNRIVAGTGSALAVVNTNIGASGLNFGTISSNGGTANGIVLDTTGASGGLTVDGDGSNTSVGGNGTGGTIGNKSGADGSTTTGIGVYLRNTRNVVLRRMVIDGLNTNYGIKGAGVDGFALEYSTVTGASGSNYNAPPNNAGEGAVYFGDYAPTNGVTGAVSIQSNLISGGAWSNLAVINSSGTATLTIKGNVFGHNGPLPTGGSSVRVEARSGATVNAIVGGTAPGEPNTFTGAPGDLVNFTGQQLSSMDVVMRNNTLTNNHPGNVIGGGGLTLATAGVMTFNVDGNTMRDAHGSAVTLFKGAGAGVPTSSGRFTNNTIGVAAVLDSGSRSGNGIFVSADGTGTMSYTINNNAIHQIHGNAHIYADNTGGSYTANFTIEGNTLDTPVLPFWFGGILLSNGAPASGDTVNVCAKIGGAGALANVLNLGGNLGIFVAASGVGPGGHTFNLPGYAGGANLANVQAFLQANNAGAFTTTAIVDPPATAAAFTGVGTTCPTP
jgi:hypothetical protein